MTEELKCNSCEHNHLINHGFFGRIHYCASDEFYEHGDKPKMGESMRSYYYHCKGKFYDEKKPKEKGKFGGKMKKHKLKRSKKMGIELVTVVVPWGGKKR